MNRYTGSHPHVFLNVYRQRVVGWKLNEVMFVQKV